MKKLRLHRAYVHKQEELAAKRFVNMEVSDYSCEHWWEEQGRIDSVLQTPFTARYRERGVFCQPSEITVLLSPSTVLPQPFTPSSMCINSPAVNLAPSLLQMLEESAMSFELMMNELEQKYQEYETCEEKITVLAQSKHTLLVAFEDVAENQDKSVTKLLVESEIPTVNADEQSFDGEASVALAPSLSCRAISIKFHEPPENETGYNNTSPFSNDSNYSFRWDSSPTYSSNSSSESPMHHQQQQQQVQGKKQSNEVSTLQSPKQHHRRSVSAQPTQPIQTTYLTQKRARHQAANSTKKRQAKTFRFGEKNWK